MQQGRFQFVNPDLKPASKWNLDDVNDLTFFRSFRTFLINAFIS